MENIKQVTCKNGHPRSHSRRDKQNHLRCRDCERASRNRYYDKHKATRSQVNALNDRRLRAIKRQALLDELGGKCVKCGFDDYRALHIDHINGGGSKEQRDVPSLSARYKLIRAHPERYQLLCANHNAIKMYENNERRSKYLY